MMMPEIYYLKLQNQHYQPLKNNAAEALGKLNDENSYNIFIEKLKSEDDWDRIDAADFLASYGKHDAVYPMLKAMASSKMAEHIAGYVASLSNLSDIFEKEGEYQELALEALIMSFQDLLKYGH